MIQKKIIVILDKEDFSFNDLIEKPLAGAQSAFIELVKAFAGLGHYVVVRNNCNYEHFEENIDWRHIGKGVVIPGADLFIVNRSISLLSIPPRGARVLFWLHNDARYLLRVKNLFQLTFRYPIIIFSGQYHRSTFPIWFLFRTCIIPLGISDCFVVSKHTFKAPKPKVIFTSNPLRSLHWLIDRWRNIRKSVPDAELHIFSGASTYGSWGKSVVLMINKVLDYVKGNQHLGIILHDPLPKSLLVEEISKSRAMLYRGDKAETFCLAVAEAQALGLPCVVQDLGSMKERVFNGLTGFVTKNDEEFEQKAIFILTEDHTWIKLNKYLLDTPHYLKWQQVGNMFLNIS